MPALRKEREERDTHFVGLICEIKRLGHPPATAKIEPELKLPNASRFTMALAVLALVRTTVQFRPSVPADVIGEPVTVKSELGAEKPTLVTVPPPAPGKVLARSEPDDARGADAQPSVRRSRRAAANLGRRCPTRSARWRSFRCRCPWRTRAECWRFHRWWSPPTPAEAACSTPKLRFL